MRISGAAGKAVLCLFAVGVFLSCSGDAHSSRLTSGTTAKLKEIGIHLDYGLVYATVSDGSPSLFAAGDRKLYYSLMPRDATPRRARIDVYDPAARTSKALYQSSSFPTDTFEINQLLFDSENLYWTERYMSGSRLVAHTRICGLDLNSGKVNALVTSDADGSVSAVSFFIAVEGRLLCYDTESDIFQTSIEQITSSIVLYDMESKKILSTTGGTGEIDISPSIRDGVLAYLRFKDGRWSVIVQDVATGVESEITKGDISTLSQPTVEDHAVIYWDATARQLIEFSLADKKTSVVPTDPLKSYYSLGPYIGTDIVAWVVGEVGPKQLAIMNPKDARFAFISLPKDSNTLEAVRPAAHGFFWSGNSAGADGVSTVYILGFF